MPTVPVNAEGSVMYYEDTGAPPDNKVYTTIALVHGLIFHSGTPYRACHTFVVVF